MLPSLLLERDAELAALTKVMSRAMGGHGSLLAVTGPPGIGKSRLLAHARNRGMVDGWRILDCRLGPLSSDVAHSVLWSWFGDLALRGSVGSHPFDGPGAAITDFCSGRTRTVADLVYAVRWVLEEISGDQAILLLVDDLEHADVGSREVLELLAPALGSLPCVLAYAVADAAQAPGRMLDASQELSLRPLQESGTATLVRGARPDLAPTDAAPLHRLSGGVPFVLRELLSEDRPGAAPDGVAGVAARCIEALPAPLLETARVAALVGADVGVSLLSAVVRRPPEPVLEDFEELIDRRVLAVDGELVRVRHPLLTDALTGGLTADERADWHARIAAVLTGLDTPAELVAPHLLRSRQGADPRVREVLADQGRRALHAGDPSLALRLLQRALAEGADRRARIELLAAMARTRAELGEVDAAVSLWEEAALLADEDSGGDALRIEAAGALTFASRADDARRMYDALLADRPHDRAWCHLAARATLACLVQGADLPPDAFDLPGVETLTEVPATQKEGLALTTAAAMHALRGGTASECRRAALRGIATGFVLEEEVTPGPLWLAAAVLAWTGAFQEGENIFSEAVAVAQDRGSTLAFAQQSSCRGYLRARMGLVSEAMFDLEVALRPLARPSDGVPVPPRADVAAALASLVECHIAHGDLELATACAEPLAVLARNPGLGGAVALQALGDLAAAAGDDEGALRHYTHVGEQLRGGIDNPAVLAWRIGAALSLVRLGRVADAVALGREDLRIAREFGAPFAIAQALRAMAAIDPTADRVGVLREALAVLGDTPAPRLAAQIATDLAGMLVLTGGADEAEVVGLLRSAEQYAGDQELRPLQDRARRLLARLGQPARRSRSEAVATLTSAERRVAGLAAEGLTNRQIAQQLFVTVKAVEWHLSNTYRKLGIRSRSRLSGIFTP
ncbi:LuxR C-terminal-related transcriptional regulator [Nocardioides pacificus]